MSWRSQVTFVGAEIIQSSMLNIEFFGLWCSTAEIFLAHVTAILGGCWNHNFILPVTHHGGCRIDWNSTVHFLIFFDTKSSLYLPTVYIISCWMEQWGVGFMGITSPQPKLNCAWYMWLTMKKEHEEECLWTLSATWTEGRMARYGIPHIYEYAAVAMSDLTPQGRKANDYEVTTKLICDC